MAERSLARSGTARYKARPSRSGATMKQYELSATKPVFRLKGGTLAATVLELGAIAPALLERQLADKVAQAPQLFQHSPLLIALDKLSEEDGRLDLAGLLDTCRRLSLHPVGVRALRPGDLDQAVGLGIAVLPPGRTRELAPAANTDVETDAESAAPAAGPATARLPVVPELSAERQYGDETVPRGGSPASEAPDTATPAPGAAGTSRPTLVVTQPVRGGQQVYAPGDLVLLAPVSAGAEVMAEGHIHVYAPLRGRALAGVQGDADARVFCRELAAELVAIAGHYHTADVLRVDPLWGSSVQILLQEGELKLIRL